MKNQFALFVMSILFMQLAWAQTSLSQSVPFQAVVRDSDGVILLNHNVSVRVTVHDTSATGAILYQETQSVMTNSSGQFTLNIGSGAAVSGATPFANAGWESRPMFTQIEIDSSGGTNYRTMVLRNCKAGSSSAPAANLKYW